MIILYIILKTITIAKIFQIIGQLCFLRGFCLTNDKIIKSFETYLGPHDINARHVQEKIKQRKWLILGITASMLGTLLGGII